MSAQVTPPSGGRPGWRPPPPHPSPRSSAAHPPFQRERSAQDVATAEVLIDQLRGGRESSAAMPGDAPFRSQSQQPQPQQQQQDDRSAYMLPPIDPAAAASSSTSSLSYGPIPAPQSTPAAARVNSTPSRNSPPYRQSAPPSASSASTSPSVTGQVCSNCGTTRTPLWRRSASGQTICNACGLYQKARNANRPPNLKRPPSYAPAFPPQSQQGQPANGQQLPNGTVYYAPDQPTQGSCPGDGKCNGTGGTAACDGCPAYNNRVSKSAQALQHQQQQQQQQQLGRATSPGSAELGNQSDNAAASENVVIACQNCHTTTTPLWRRDLEGHTICNACGLYFKLHGHHRPVEMKKSYIKRRKRVAPAMGEQQAQRANSRPASNPTQSSSPEAAPPSYPASEAYSHSSTVSHIDPSLNQAVAHGPVPVDFTSYDRTPQHHSTPGMAAYDPLHDPSNAASAPSPKRQRFSPVHSAASSGLVAPAEPSRTLPIHPHALPPLAPSPTPTSSRGEGDGRASSRDGAEDEEKRRKRMKRDILRQQIAEMQRQVHDLGESDDE